MPIRRVDTTEIEYNSGDNTYTLPTTRGANDYVLTRDNSIGTGGTTWKETQVPPTITSITYPTQNGVQATALAATGAQDTTAETLLINGQHFTSTVTVNISGNGVSGAFAGTVSVNGTGTVITCSNVTKRASADGYTLTVTNSTGLNSTTTVNFSADPSFTTASDLGYIYETQSLSKSIVATGDGTISYSEGATSLPSWITLTGATGALTGTAPSVTSATQQNFDIVAQDSQNQTHTRGFTITTLDANASFGSVYEFAEALSTTPNQTTPTNKGTLTINGVSLGSYGYVKYGSNTTISSFSNSDWFAGTADTYSSWIVVDGDLTINSGQTLTPSVRKLFTVLYVNGNLVVNGGISMTARGANHSGTGNSVGATTAGNIKLHTISSTVYQVGASGATAQSSGHSTGNGNNGGNSSGTLTTGSGGGGRSYSGGNVVNTGSDGTSFTGGTGGGGEVANSAGTAGTANGGAGGAGASNSSSNPSGGGAGNPGGSGQYGGNGQDGTGGVLIIFCTGNVSGSGSIQSHGSQGGNVSPSSGQYGASGGGSGGGLVSIFYKGSNSITPTATGGSGGLSNGAGDNTVSGSGGNGFAGSFQYT